MRPDYHSDQQQTQYPTQNDDEQFDQAPMQEIQVITHKLKKPHKNLYVLIGIIVALIIVAVASYFVFSYYKSEEKIANDKKAAILLAESNKKVSNPAVNLATSTLTDSLSSESKITNTDDSAIATGINGTTGSIGGSIDENSF